MNNPAHHELNCEGQLCPMPVIKTQNKIKELQPGDTLTVSCTDPGALQDIPTWCRINDHEVTGHEQQGRLIYISIRV